MLESWQIELQSAVKSLEEIQGYAFLPKNLVELEKKYRTLVPRYYLSLIDAKDPEDPIAKMAFPRSEELGEIVFGLRDPIGDLAKNPASRLTHRYRDRALLHVTNLCPMYCRFCFRKNLMNEKEEDLYSGDFSSAFSYLEEHGEIEELILTGGDPWMLSNAKIEGLLRELSSRNTHIKRIRFHTRMPVTLPSRVNKGLIAVLKVFSQFQFVVVAHFNHPRECTPEANKAIEELREQGIWVFNQSVLLKGVNDRAETLRDLWSTLGSWGVLPYYLHHCDLVEGAEHFRTTFEHGRALMNEVRGTLPGYFLPHYVLDRPGGAGKIPLEVANFSKNANGSFQIPGVNEPYFDPLSI
jgi:lysine 2,3-aminomutase